MKKILLLAVATVFMLSVSAQNGPKGPAMKLTPKERAEKVTKQLELTKDQTAQLESFYAKQDKRREEAMAKEDKAREGMKEKFAAQRKADDAELEKILGKEKFQKYADQREQMMKKRMEKKGAGPQKGAPENE